MTLEVERWGLEELDLEQSKCEERHAHTYTGAPASVTSMSRAANPWVLCIKPYFSMAYQICDTGRGVKTASRTWRYVYPDAVTFLPRADRLTF